MSKKVNFKPNGKRVLVEQDSVSDKTESGIIIPDGAKQKPNSGVIRAIGGQVEEARVGDQVLYGKYAGTEVELDGTEYLIMVEDDILGVV